MLNKQKPVETIVNKENCSKCGLCTEICPNYLTKDENGFPTARDLNDEENIFGCIQCGNCMMICPNEALEIKGEDIDKSHLRELNRNLPDYEAINSLFLKRRSCRKYKKQEIEMDLIDKIINSAATAAVSIPPSEVKVLVINGNEKVQELAEDLIKPLSKFTKMSALFLPLIRLMTGKANYEMFKDFIIPLSKDLVKSHHNGIDELFYNAPAVIVFYGSQYSDKEDWMIAATQATIAAEALGLGTCFIGTVGAMLQNNPDLRQKYGILKNDKVGSAFILGYPEIKYKKAFQRSFKKVTYMP